MKPNTALIKYKDQPVINLNNVVAMNIHGSTPWSDWYTIDYKFVNEEGASWLFKTREETQAIYDKICSLFVTDLT